MVCSCARGNSIMHSHPYGSTLDSVAGPRFLSPVEDFAVVTSAVEASAAVTSAAVTSAVVTSAGNISPAAGLDARYQPCAGWRQLQCAEC